MIALLIIFYFWRGTIEIEGGLAVMKAFLAACLAASALTAIWVDVVSSVQESSAAPSGRLTHGPVPNDNRAPLVAVQQLLRRFGAEALLHWQISVPGHYIHGARAKQEQTCCIPTMLASTV